ncbi:MAG: GNAT family N-acetyltransferase [Bacilli bacterium]
MIYRLATSNDIPILKQLWYECFIEHDGQASIDYYFTHDFKLENTFVLQVDDTIVCSLQLNQHQLEINKQIHQVSFVVGVATFIKERHKGYMKQLLNYAIDYATKVWQQDYMILQAYNWDIYRPFGFQEVYFKNKFTINDPLVEQANDLIEIKYTTKLLKDIYDGYTTNLNGYKIRNEDYFHKLINQLKIDHLEIVVNQEAYCLYSKLDNIVTIVECAYLNEASLYSLLKSLQLKSNQIILNTDLGVELINGQAPIKELFMMMKSLKDKPLPENNLYISEWI